MCEACQLKLAECPHCRGVYVGTRNYVLEAVISKLKRFRAIDNFIRLGDDDDEISTNQSTNEAPEDALLSDANQSEAATSESATTAKILAPKGRW